MELTIFETSDIHGYLYPSDYQERAQDLNFGLFKAAAKIKKERAKLKGPSLYIDNGDFIQGSPFSYYIVKEKETAERLMEALDDLQVDAATIGNHEFNYGMPYLESAIQSAKHPVLAANILNEEGKPAFGEGYTVFEKEGIKIAVLGLVTQYIPHWEHPENYKGLTFQSAVECAKEYVPKLRAEADVVIVSYHGGLERDLETGEPTEILKGENEGYQILSEVNGIDVMLTGHQHRQIAEVWNGIPVVQPGHKGEKIGKVTLTIEKTDEGVVISHPTAELLSVDDVKADELLEEKFDQLNEEVENWLDQVIGKVEGDMTIKDVHEARIVEHPYIEFIQKVQMYYGGCDVSGTALFNNDAKGFGNDVTMRDVVTNYIYPNTLAVSRITGADLKGALELSAEYFDVKENGELGVSRDFIVPKPKQYNYDMYEGVDYTIDASRPRGERIVSLTYKGKDLLPEDTLDVVINQYRAVGGGDFLMFDASQIIREVTISMPELIGDYFKEHPVVKAEANLNFKVIH